MVTKLPRHTHRWTDEEREVVRRDYKGNRDSLEEIGRRLGVSTNAIKGQIQTMGLARQDRHPWDPEQDARLEFLMEKHCARQVANIMHRSLNSVVVRAKRIGIHRRCHSGWYNKREVCEILGVDHRWLQKRINSGAIKASFHDPDSPPKDGGSGSWHIREKDLRDYICRYAQELTSRNVDLITIVDILAGLITPDNQGKAIINNSKEGTDASKI